MTSVVSNFKLQEIGPEHIMEAVHAGWLTRNTGGIDATLLTKFSKISIAYARRALFCAVQLGMMESLNKKFITIPEARTIGNVSRKNWPTVFCSYLAKYNPFVLFLTLIGQDFSVEDAARKVFVVFTLGSSEEKTKQIFVKWGIYAGLLERGNNRQVIVSANVTSLETADLKQLRNAMTNEVNARVYISKVLGSDAFSFVPPKDVNFFASAIKNYRSSPRNSIIDVGTALENILRKFCASKTINASAINGIGSLADALRKKGFMLSKHQDLCKGLNALRICAVHGADKQTGIDWDLTAYTALATIMLSLSFVHSVYTFIYDNAEQVL
jgi:hypothetical protein